MGFSPTIVVDAPFDTPERRDFAQRVARPLAIEDERLKGADLPPKLCWWFNRDAGAGLLAPEYGVLLVVTNERRQESVFGFLRYPRKIFDGNGSMLMEVDKADHWTFGSFIDSPDPRYRAIVRRFSTAGFLSSELDEFVQSSGGSR